MPIPLEYETDRAVRLPGAVLVFAWLYIVAGAVAAFHFGWAIAEQRFVLDLTVLGVFIGRGLLLRIAAARSCAVAISWLGMIASVVWAAMLAWRADKVHFLWNRQPVDMPVWAALILGLAICAGLFLLNFWQLRVMRRPGVMAMFPDPHPDVTPQRRGLWRLWIWFLALLAIILAGYLTQLWVGRSNGWTSVPSATWTSTYDHRGNYGAWHATKNSVGIVATGQAGSGASWSVDADACIVEVGKPPRQYKVPLKANRLCIVLPDGSVGEFRVSSGYAARMATGGSDSLLRDAVEAMDDPGEKTRLEQFLANFNEPPSWMSSAATRPALPRPSTRASESP